ncbi:hypothetical protein ACEXQD_06700 [Herbiconiux sp. P15]|uniref:hypothetical protein n=1 Tax=Herbiconiux liukaitaii TaxID=3342799 RepID=UPI0035BB7919
MERRTFLHAAWAAPVLAVAVVSPARATGTPLARVEWLGSDSTQFGETVTLRLTIPAGSSAIRRFGYLDVSTDAEDNTVELTSSGEWRGTVPNGEDNQRFAPRSAFTENSYLFFITFDSDQPETVTYTAQLRERYDDEALSDPAVLTVSAPLDRAGRQLSPLSK